MAQNETTEQRRCEQCGGNFPADEIKWRELDTGERFVGFDRETEARRWAYRPTWRLICAGCEQPANWTA